MIKNFDQYLNKMTKFFLSILIIFTKKNASQTELNLDSKKCKQGFLDNNRKFNN